ncbi:type VII secretion target [Streptomyces tubbatahanensis]|uniref:Type VII secretion target n=1 Tax=Streptomyces tubbatahanensis TaxID=2923272 RepID=A0ABY3XYB8_9ACTN|nr:type VII secretion target [Streptomyces tubbatahanensis]UNS99540.1 type VII secretion target [Streptomyces tubbatahanensis]
MSFQEEWARIKSAYAPDGSAHTRLAGTGAPNGHPDGRQGPRPGLTVTAGVLRGRAGRAETVRGWFLQADDAVMRETGQVTGSLKGFCTDTALAAFQERWREQMAYVSQQFTGTATALRDAAGAFTAEDHRRKQDLDAVPGGEHRDGGGS